MLRVEVPQMEHWKAVRNELAAANPQLRREIFDAQARKHRRDDLKMIHRSGQGHVGGDMSVMDILTALFFQVLDVDPEDPKRPNRDRLILSKGHTAGALYAVLANCGFFSPDELTTFLEPLSPLNGHPNRLKVPGVEANTGPLGHGLPVGVGAAHASRLTGRGYRTFVILGDGELQEGSNWEAFMSAAHFKLDRLYAVIDRNRLQQGARTDETTLMEPLSDKLKAFGWEVREIDGHDYDQIIQAFRPAEQGRPVAVIANTVKGKGISYMEDRVAWHHKVPTEEQFATAMEELA